MNEPRHRGSSATARRWTATRLMRTLISAMAACGVLVLGGVRLGTGIAASPPNAELRSTPAAAVPVRDAAVVSSPAPTPLSNPLVILYGDSLAWEAKDAFVQAFAGHPEAQIITRTFGGTAICDWLDQMRDDAANLAPGAVVLEFSGNNLTPCMEDVDGRGLTGDAYWARYRADAQAAIDTFAPHNTRVYLAGAPISYDQEASGDFHGGLVNAMYEQLAGERVGVVYVDAGAAVLDHGRWTATLPCVPGEPCTGGTDRAGRAVNLVRAPDGGHFCPAAEEAKLGIVGACPVWSSGAFRYANAMARPVLAALSA
jgi:hypothetical protein